MVHRFQWFDQSLVLDIQHDQSFLSFITEKNFDLVTINRCTSSSSCEQVAQLSGINSAFMSSIYASNIGYMQVLFTSDKSMTFPGFVATWSS
jgi:hypothetical protein